MARQMSPADIQPVASDLLERRDEFQALADSLDVVRRTAAGRIVFVSGEAGVGKTALLREFRASLARNVRILWGGCDPLFTPRPLGPLLGMADAAGGRFETALEITAAPTAPAKRDSQG